MDLADSRVLVIGNMQVMELGRARDLPGMQNWVDIQIVSDLTKDPAKVRRE